MSKDNIGELKFIASMFRMAMEEFNNVMGLESIQTIFRLIGENQGTKVEERLREKFNINTWTPEDFAEKFNKDVLDPALGLGNSEIKVEGNKIKLILKECPFKRAGIDISNKFYCTYTEGLIETAAKKAFGNIDFKTDHLQSEGNEGCTFELEVK